MRRRSRCGVQVTLGRGVRAAGAVVAAWVAALACTLPPAVSERALLLVDRGQEREAVALLEDHLGRQPDDIEALRLLVRVQGRRGDLARARKQAERLARLLPPGSPEPWIELGHACELAHRYDAALAMYDHAGAVAPDRADGPKRGGLRALRWGELEAAETRLREAARRDPGDAETWHALGLLHLQRGHLDAARLAYTQGLRANPEALENRLGLATVALAARRPEDALREYDALIAARPEHAPAHLGRSWSLILLGRFRDAERALAHAEAIGGHRAVIARQRRALAGLAQALRARGRRGDE